jgi:hypothetical protein
VSNPRAGWIAAAALALTGGGLMVGCGGDDGATSATSKPTAADGGAAGASAAAKTVEQYTAAQAFKVEPLPQRPKQGVRVAEVNCNVPDCNPKKLADPLKALGWRYENYNFDIAKGPQDFARQFDRAIAAKPDFITATMTFGDAVARAGLAKAKAAGIPVLSVGALKLGDFAGNAQGAKQGFRMGQLVASQVLADAKGKTAIAVGNDPAIGLPTPIVDGIKDIVTKEGRGTTVDEFKLSIARPPEANAAAIINYVQRNPDVKYLILSATQVSVGTYPRLRAAGVLDKVKVFKPYANPTDLPDIANRDISGAVAGERDFSWRVADYLARLSVGRTPRDKEPIGEFRMLTPDRQSMDLLDPPDYQTIYKQAWKVG